MPTAYLAHVLTPRPDKLVRLFLNDGSNVVVVFGMRQAPWHIHDRLELQYAIVSDSRGSWNGLYRESGELNFTEISGFLRPVNLPQQYANGGRASHFFLAGASYLLSQGIIIVEG